MDKLLMIKDWLMGDKAFLIVGVLFGISESLAMIPAVKANSVFQAIVNAIKFVKEKIFKK